MFHFIFHFVPFSCDVDMLTCAVPDKAIAINKTVNIILNVLICMVTEIIQSDDKLFQRNSSKFYVRTILVVGVYKFLVS